MTRLAALALACIAAPLFARADVPPAGVIAPAPDASPDGVTRFTLANGMRVLLRPAAASDEAAVVVLFSFGESSDPEGKSGMAHLVEHLYLTAAAGQTPSRTYEQLSSHYMQQMNAQTGEDYTIFAGIVPAQSLKEELTDAAARLKGPTIEQTDLDREKPRMYLELANMYAGIPSLAARNEARSRVRPAPEGARKGGVIEQIKSITLDEARERLKFYKPANATLCIVGGIDVNQAHALVRQIFEPLPSGQKAPARRESKAGVKSETLTLPLLPAGSPAASLAGFNVPTPGAPHYAATLIVVSRLQAKLFKPGAPPATQLPPVAHPVLDDPNMLFISIPHEPNETLEAATKRLDDMIDQACTGPVTAEERTRVRTMVGPFLGLSPLSDQVASMNVYGAAFSIGRREQMRYDAAMLDAALENLTEQDLRACHAALLAPAKRSSIALVGAVKPAAPAAPPPGPK